MGTRTRERVTKHGTLAATVWEAARIWSVLKAEGASLAERVRTMTVTIRAVWPFTREWHYLCAACEDHGLSIASCPGDTSCGRAFRHGPHEYGTPCFCPKGDRFRVKSRPEKDFISATKVRQPTRIGR